MTSKFEPQLVVETADGMRAPLARGTFAALVGCAFLGTARRYTHAWGGWRHPLSVVITEWRGAERVAGPPEQRLSVWQSTGAARVFAPTHYVRLAFERWRDRKEKAIARGIIDGLVQGVRAPLPTARVVRR